MERLELSSNAYECLWAKITCGIGGQPFWVASLYHPPQSTYDETGLIEFLINSCDEILSSSPGAEIIIAGDLNQLNLQNIMLHTDLSQMLKVPTRGNHTLDAFLTNTPWNFSKVTCAKSLVKTDHLGVFVHPKVKPPPPKRHLAEFRDVREHRKVQMFGLLKHIDWSPVINEPNVRTAVHAFYSILKPIFDTCFPIIRVKAVSSNEPLYRSPLLRHLLNRRRKFLYRGMAFEAANLLQPRINELIRTNQINYSGRKAPSHKMQMVFLLPSSSSVSNLRDCAVRPLYVTVLCRQNGRRLPGLFV